MQGFPLCIVSVACCDAQDGLLPISMESRFKSYEANLCVDLLGSSFGGHPDALGVSLAFALVEEWLFGGQGAARFL